MSKRKSFFQKMNRVVVKVGTNILSDEGEISLEKFKLIVDEISVLKSFVKDVIVISSGAIGAGYKKILDIEKPMTIPLKQASASIGQVIVMKYYMDMFEEKGYVVSQILLTDNVLNDRVRYVNAKNTLNTLLQYDVIPIVNENDTVAVDEIKFGENDTLAALVTSLVDADLLILLSDIDGLYLNYDNPDKRVLMNEVHGITDEIEAEGKAKGSTFGSGGMVTKLKAAKITTHHGIPMLIASGKDEGIIERIFSGEIVGTLFFPIKDETSTNKKRWIHLNSKAKGQIIIDENAVKALVEGNKSLLPTGVLKVTGDFHNYDTVEILDQSEKVIAKGVANYNHGEIDKIKGCHSSEIEGILGYRYYDVVVHKDNLVTIG